MQRVKIIKIGINYVVAPLLFLWLLHSLYTQIVQQPHLEESWQHIKTSLTSRKVIVLFGVVLLMLLNWSVEAVKWKLSVAVVQPVPFWRAAAAVLSGVLFSVAMPNRMGEYAGRVLYLPQGSRLKAVPVTLVGNGSQLLVTLVAGMGGLLVLKKHLIQSGLVSSRWYAVLCFGTAVATTLLTFFYFGIRWWVKPLQRWLSRSGYAPLLQAVERVDASLLLWLLSLSLLRYIIFSVQYVLLFSFFGVHVAPHLAWAATAVLFLVMAVVPTIALAELGLRGQLSLHLMGLFTANSLGVVLTSATVWAVNLIVPALAGSILILTFTLFKRKHEIV